jgi:hypothetical protein
MPASAAYLLGGSGAVCQIKPELLHNEVIATCDASVYQWSFASLSGLCSPALVCVFFSF